MTKIINKTAVPASRFMYNIGGNNSELRFFKISDDRSNLFIALTNIYHSRYFFICQDKKAIHFLCPNHKEKKMFRIVLRSLSLTREPIQTSEDN